MCFQSLTFGLKALSLQRCLRERDTADPSTPLRFGRDDKLEGGYLPEDWLFGSKEKSEIALFRNLKALIG
jgi:hypothetical protein